ncbi:granzyme B(G,H) [Trichomycterus rosablanca]|uniref:granzyme B(G,H) n=1 Tax=Trichomycterus rosablanca TaxID=2290929 RepID=UPI002F3597E0
MRTTRITTTKQHVTIIIIIIIITELVLDISDLTLQHNIVGGRVSVPHSRPYMVFIRDVRSNTVCDGFLVSKSFVLTAAHCNKPSIVVFLGVNDTMNVNYEDAIFVKKIPHPNYNNKTFENDIMLLKLDKPADFSKTVMPIALPESKNEAFTRNCLVTGWGNTDFRHNFPSRVLREVNVTISKASNCTVPDMMCSEGNTGPSHGDSGGPLVCGDVAHGIVSSNYKYHCQWRARYIRTSYHLNWIHFVINQHYEG